VGCRGPSVQNGNPERLRSRAMHCFATGAFPRNGAAGPMEELPAAQQLVPARGPPRCRIARSWSTFRERATPAPAAARRGEGPVFRPAGTKWHLSEATWRLLTGMWFCGGRGYGAGGPGDGRSGKRAVNAAGTPVLTLRSPANVWIAPWHGGPSARTLGLGLVVLAGSACHAAGEVPLVCRRGADGVPSSRQRSS